MESITLEEFMILQDILTNCQLTTRGKDTILKLATLIIKIDCAVTTMQSTQSKESGSPQE